MLKRMNRDQKIRLSIAIIIILAIIGYFAWNWYSEKNNHEENNSDGTTISTLDPDSSNNGAQPGNNDIGGDNNNSNSDSSSSNDNNNSNSTKWTNPFVPERGATDSPSPTVPNPKATEIKPGEVETDIDTYDPKQVDMGTSAGIVAREMFSLTIGNNNSYEDSMKKILATHGTERAKRVGLVKWWNGDEHSPSWESLKFLNTRIISSPKFKSEELWSNDIVRVRFDVNQYIQNKNYSAKLSPYTIDLYMKYVDGGWYLDAYDFPDNNYPSIH